MRAARKQSKDQDAGLEYVPAVGNMDEENDGLEDLSPEERERVLKKRKLIRDGMGGALGGGGVGMGGEEDDGEIEYTPSGTPTHHSMPARVDERTYASDEEEYDSDDNVTTLALGTMMLRKSRAKKVIS